MMAQVTDANMRQFASKYVLIGPDGLNVSQLVSPVIFNLYQLTMK